MIAYEQYTFENLTFYKYMYYIHVYSFARFDVAAGYEAENQVMVGIKSPRPQRKP